jgi:hypothetical protein
MRKLQLAVILAAAAIVWTLPARAANETFDKTYPLSPGGTFALQNVNGTVEISGWDRNEVQIHAVKTAAHDSEDLSKVTIDVDADASHVAVKTIYPEEKGVEVSVAYTVHVPQHVLLGGIATVNGGIEVMGLDSSGELRSVNGNVEVSDSSGSLSAHTTNGDIHMELRRLGEAPVAAETVNGSIVVALVPGANAALDVRTLNGDFRSDFPVAALSASGAREFHGQLGSGGSAMRLRTVNGSVRIVEFKPTV